MQSALESSGNRETGGILMGEHVATDTFRIKSLTVQRGGGAFASFVRVIHDIVAPLTNFFRDTNHNYRRFNYLGEWHSHPSFALVPSSTDIETMRDLVDDPEVGATFAVLLIVKLNPQQRLEGRVFVFPASRPPLEGSFEIEP